MTKIKTIIEGEIKCPHCKKYISVKHIKTILTPSVKGETREELIAEKSKQTRLGKEG